MFKKNVKARLTSVVLFIFFVSFAENLIHFAKIMIKFLASLTGFTIEDKRLLTILGKIWAQLKKKTFFHLLKKNATNIDRYFY